jgi:N utilization substance protein B
MPEAPPDITRTGLKTRLARRLAMQILFVWDAAGRPDDAEAEHVTADAARDVDPNDVRAMTDAHAARQRALAAARSVWGQWDWINQSLERIAPQWPPKRMPAVDRAILRLGIWELANTPTPPAVVIDEAIELAREFSTSDSPKFVNGVLDKVLKEREALIGGLEAPAAGGEEPRTTDH